MKKKLFLVLSIMLLGLISIPSVNALAAGEAVDVDTGTAGDVLTTYVVTTGDDTDIAGAKNYVVNVPVDTKQVVLPITFEQKGIIFLSSDFAESVSSRYLDIDCYSDAECTKEVDVSFYSGKATIPEKGTYYIKFKVSDYTDTPPTDGYKINFSSRFVTGEDKTLSNGDWACSALSDYKTPVYFKISASKAGSITISTESEYSNNITLLNSSKKAISDEVYNYKEKVCFAVEKGTYYIKVSSSSELLRIKYNLTAITDISGSSKTKSRKLTAGKTYTGYLSATNKKGATDWYKIALTKSQEVDISFKGSVSSGEIELEFYGNGISGSLTRRISTMDGDSSFKPELWTSSKLPKGTYYIKITKNTTNTSGYYKLQLKK